MISLRNGVESGRTDGGALSQNIYISIEKEVLGTYFDFSSRCTCSLSSLLSSKYIVTYLLRPPPLPVISSFTVSSPQGKFFFSKLNTSPHNQPPLLRLRLRNQSPLFTLPPPLPTLLPTITITAPPEPCPAPL